MNIYIPNIYFLIHPILRYVAYYLNVSFGAHEHFFHALRLKGLMILSFWAICRDMSSLSSKRDN